MASVRYLTVDDLPQITEIHLAAFPDSALTKLGSEAVRRYYEWQIVGPHDAVNIGIFDQDTLLGFCFGGVFRGALGGFLEKNRSFLIQRILTHPWLLLNPLFRERVHFAMEQIYNRVFVRTLKAVKTSAELETTPAPSFGILSIAVMSKQWGSGAAQKLMEETERIAIKRNFARMGLTVHPSNVRAVRFYEKMGWQRALHNGVWTGSMVKYISSRT
jgi:ribosomal protein S18 acetylase RimI-like enzyme